LLGDAELLIRHAAETGITIKPEIVDAIETSRDALNRNEWSHDKAKQFWSAYGELCATVKPLTAESLKACTGSLLVNKIRNYRRATIWLTTIILPLSVLMFVNTSISNEITERVNENNQLALKVRDAATALIEPVNPQNLGAATPAGPRSEGIVRERDVAALLQEFAAGMRILYGRTGILNDYILRGEHGPFAEMTNQQIRSELEIDPKSNVAEGSFRNIITYQTVRSFAKQVQQMNLVVYGAITAYVLPVLYSLLGACAYELRSLSQFAATRTYVPSPTSLARIVVALIAGLVVGLFSNFTQGVTLSPLAVAFLVGYAVEVFFSFLDAFLETLRKIRS